MTISLIWSSTDNVVNLNGHMLLEFLKQTGLRVANGRVGEDKNVGACTYVGSKGSSLVNFCIVNVELLSEFSTFYVHDPNILSDYCLIEFSLASRFSYCQTDNPVKNIASISTLDGMMNIKRNTKITLFPKPLRRFARLSYMVEDACTETEINESISFFSDLMDNICIPLIGKKTSNPKPQNSSNKNDFIFNNICMKRENIFILN